MFAVIHLPNFLLQSALRTEPELRARPVALVAAELAKASVVQVTAAARARGVSEGLTPSQALARCGELLIKTRSAAREQSAAEVLLQTAYAFSPHLEATAPGVCTLELKGLALAGATAKHAWAAKILAVLAQFQLEAQVGFAPTPGLALIAAQVAAPIQWVEDPGEFVQHLPIAALHPPPDIAAILSLWGIHTVGAFLALGKDALAERLGPLALDLCASINHLRPLRVVSPPETFVERMDFPHEIETTEPLLFVLRRFLEQLALRLETVYLVITELQLELTLSSGNKYRRTFKIPSPTNNLRILFRMLQTHLETVRTDAPISSLQLRAEPGKPELHQFGLFDTTLRDPNQFAETLARLTVLCGAENIGTPRLEATHRPDAFRMTTPDFSPPALSPGEGGPPGRAPRQGTQLRRFRPCPAATIEFREAQPALLRSRVFNGAIAAARGPFLSSGAWWDEQRWAREEWDVQTVDGALYRVFRSEDGCFVEGVYD